jgi:hypothetical protein
VTAIKTISLGIPTKKDTVSLTYLSPRNEI